ncbi:MAG: AraC family transcriptional regulator [Kofleriaceae bacterium]|nr:AraC family transcriptional regulator [Kofleriaceae bacterium]
MLVAQGESTVVESRLKAAIFLERRFRVYVAWRDRLLFDTKFAPPAQRPSGVITLLFVLEGTVSVDHGPPQVGPIALAFAEHEFERVVPGAPTLRSWGAPYVAVELRLKTTEVPPNFASVSLARGPLSVPPPVWEAATAFVETIATGRTSTDELRRWLAALAAAGIVSDELSESIQDEPEHLRRLWSVLAAGFARHATSLSLLQIKRELGLSFRQLYRDASDLADTFDLLGDGFRSTLKLLRLRAAVLWLSAPEATLIEIAKHVGYGSVAAMNRALREVGLPGPAALREQLRYPAR